MNHTQGAREPMSIPEVQTAIRQAGGIVHSDGNIFFTGAEQFIAAAVMVGKGPPPVKQPEDAEHKLARHAIRMFQDEDHVHWTSAHDRVVIDALRLYLGYGKPIDMVLHCPQCGMQHIDRSEVIGYTPTRAGTFTNWDNPPHRSHLCRTEDGGCGYVWRPADVATNGVAKLRTRGEKDSPGRQPAEKDPERLLLIARALGLRQLMHGVDPATARAALALFHRAASIPPGELPQVGDRIKLVHHEAWPVATVTELTDHGFKWRFDAPHVSHARMGMVIVGGEECQADGWVLIERPASPGAPK